MSELDEAWELALAEATRRARGAGRADIARYLDLRSRNDLLRRAAIDWLAATFTALAADANRKGAAIQIQRQDTHRFRRGSATMVGPQLTLRNGVRSLVIETGWPRTPRDGFIRGGGLACANLKHLGRKQLNVELTLVSSASGSPQWFVLDEDRPTSLVNESHLRHHLAHLTHA
jgi:hypothetical protein